MNAAGRIWRVIVVASLLAVSTTLLVPALTGRPVLSYASSGSMEPTIGVFDVFLVNPWPVDLGHGDIVVFHSVTRGGPAVHRIVGGDESGWLTRGDANAGIDQDIGEPPVTRDRVIGKVVTRGDGTPLLLGDAGLTYVEGSAALTKAQQAVGGPRILLALLLLAVALLFGVIGALAPKGRPEDPRSLRRRDRILRRVFPRGILGRHVAIGLALALLVTTTWAATQARTPVEVEMVVVAQASPADTVRATSPGNSLARDIEVKALASLPTVVVVEPAANIAPSDPYVAMRPSAKDVTQVWQRAGNDIGLQQDTVVIWQYPMLLPPAAIHALHEFSPGLPFLVLPTVIAFVGAIWFRALRISDMPVGRMLGIREDWR